MSQIQTRNEKKNIKGNKPSSLGTKKKDGTCVIEAYNFDQEIIRRALAEARILHEYPFRIVNHIMFRKFVRSCF